MLSLKKIQLWVLLLSLVFLSLVKQTGMTEMLSLARNSSISDMSSSRNISTEQEVSNYAYIYDIYSFEK